MAKARSRYVCQNCGADSRQYFGKCPFCGSWNSMVEEAVPETHHRLRFVPQQRLVKRDRRWFNRGAPDPIQGLTPSL